MSHTSAFHCVTAAERAQRHGHLGLVVWFTGLSGAGKTTLAEALERTLFDQGCQVCILDGDLIRTGLCSDLGFDSASRSENIRRVGEVAMLLANAGVVAIGACISPLRADRERIRSACVPGKFVEVFVNAPLAVCEQRDPKGLYAKARANLIKDFTGINSAYEPPLRPEVEVRTDQWSVEQCLERLLEAIEPRLRKKVSPIHA